MYAPSGKSPFVLTDKRGNRYALMSQTGWGGSLSGGFGSIQLTAYKKKYVKLFFNKLNNVNDIYSLTEVDCNGSHCWNFYNIKLNGSNVTKIPERTTNTTTNKSTRTYSGNVNSSGSSSGSSTSSTKNTTKTTYVNTKKFDKSKASAKFDETWIDYDVYDEDGRYGMRIHTKFTVYNMKDQLCYFTVRFMKDKKFLKTTNYKFKNTSGQIELKKSLRPAYESTVYKDKAVFMPYKELNLTKGKHYIKADVDVFHSDGSLLKHLGFKEFKYTKN